MNGRLLNFRFKFFDSVADTLNKIMKLLRIEKLSTKGISYPQFCYKLLQMSVNQLVITKI